MTSLDLDTQLAIAERAAKAGGEIVRASFGRARDAREKSAGDWVSAADLTSERAIREVLYDESGLPVFGEEQGGDAFDTGWLVDPLDGTANFLHGFDAVGVSVGLIDKGAPIAGVVYAPLRDRCFAAARGRGAVRDGQRIEVSARSPGQAIVATGFPFRRKELLDTYEGALGRALRGFEDLRRVGAASLDLCWTAEGVFDGFFELRLGPWDVAAGALIVREAGVVAYGRHSRRAPGRARSLAALGGDDRLTRTGAACRLRRTCVPSSAAVVSAAPRDADLSRVKILVACRDCGEAHVRPEEVTIRTCIDDGGVSYRFQCRFCGRPTVARTKAHPATRALLAGAELELWSYPLELDERRAGPPLDPDDVAVLRHRMDRDDWIAELAD
jgi:myo-inositol-1(or 4)-monophosphatase